METSESDYLKQLDILLTSGSQSWLFGAGISLNANIPLMGALTARVLKLAEGTPGKGFLAAIQEELPADAHIEHILSQIGDYATIAERCESSEVKVGGNTYSLEILHKLHDQLLKSIAETVRWGYQPKSDHADEKIGSPNEPLVTIDEHIAFVIALLGRRQAGLIDRRRPVRLFSTNYDTLLEDALALECLSYWDGFSGGAIAFRTHHYGEKEPDTRCRAHVVKLHGSIDWQLGNDGKVRRVRHSDGYPSRLGPVLIYPQSTKYLAAQHDPFAGQFDLFRQAIGGSEEKILAICGYSFGDEHINQEINLAVQHPDKKVTVLAFSCTLNDQLEIWRNSNWGKRLYIITEAGLYVGAEGPFYSPKVGTKLDWWTFAGITKILNNGAEGSAL